MTEARLSKQASSIFSCIKEQETQTRLMENGPSMAMKHRLNMLEAGPCLKSDRHNNLLIAKISV